MAGLADYELSDIPWLSACPSANIGQVAQEWPLAAAATRYSDRQTISFRGSQSVRSNWYIPSIEMVRKCFFHSFIMMTIYPGCHRGWTKTTCTSVGHASETPDNLILLWFATICRSLISVMASEVWSLLASWSIMCLIAPFCVTCAPTGISNGSYHLLSHNFPQSGLVVVRRVGPPILLDYVLLQDRMANLENFSRMQENFTTLQSFLTVITGGTSFSFGTFYFNFSQCTSVVKLIQLALMARSHSHSLIHLERCN